MSTPDDVQFEPVPRPGMSGTTKVLLILGGVGGLCLLVCCGVAGFIGWKAKNSMSDDPVVITKLSQSIVEMDIPADFTPKQSMDMFGVMKMAIYTAPKHGMLMLIGFGKMFADPQQQEQMKQQMKQQHGPKDQKVLSTETKEVEIGGKKVPFEFAKTEDTGSHEKFEQVNGFFPGKEGPVVLMLLIPEDEYDEEEVLKMLQSIH